MVAVQHLSVRDDGLSSTSTTIKLLVALIIIAVFGLVLIGTLLVLRHLRKAKNDSKLPMYNDLYRTNSSGSRRLTITASTKRPKSLTIYQEKMLAMSDGPSPPQSPIPEIRITFPEEIDESGKKQSGRVLVVRVGEHSIGLEPLQEDLPPYQMSHSDRFQSLDLERMGGLKEKEKQWS